MDKQFDELSKSLAEGVSRRGGLKKFGFGLAVVLLAAVGIQGAASAKPCASSADCGKSQQCCGGTCLDASIGCYCANPCPPGTTCKRVRQFYSYYGQNRHSDSYQCA